MQIQPYLFFEGRCDEAVEFYRRALGAEVLMLMRFGESPDPPPPGMLPPGWEKKVMHASLRIGESMMMASDGHGASQAGFQGFRLSLSPPDVPTAERLFAALADGGRCRCRWARRSGRRASAW